MTMTRRTFMAGCTSLAMSAGMMSARAQEPRLGALAALSGRFFGTALSSFDLANGGHYAQILDEECWVWVPEWQLKWGALVRDRADRPDFTAVDAIVQAALGTGKRVRGHTLLWHEHLPDWVTGLSKPADWDRVVAPHIREVAAHYRDKIFQWDVVNEAIEPVDGGRDLMRRTPFYRMRGPGYVGDAFRLAHEAAPAARLYLNEYSVCYADTWQEKRRTGLLRLLESLLEKGVPVHGLGIQGHLDTRFSFDERVFSRFLETVAGLGLEITITELDVREADKAGGMDIPARQARAAEEVRKVLSVALDNSAVEGVVTWGLSDSESWLRKARDLPTNQGLPYDDQLRPTPMRRALAELFGAARKRHD